MNCNICGSELALLFTSRYCPNDCDLKPIDASARAKVGYRREMMYIERLLKQSLAEYLFEPITSKLMDRICQELADRLHVPSKVSFSENGRIIVDVGDRRYAFTFDWGE